MTTAQIAKIMALVRNHGELSAERAHYLVLRRSMSDIEAALRDAPQWPPCRGVPRAGCNYLAACDTVCNKCGQVHRFPDSVAPSAPTAVEPDERAMFEAWVTGLGYRIRIWPDSGRYHPDSMHDKWEGWQARASKGTPL